MALAPDYLIIIDLEASGTDTYNVNRSEITEWPWVVYDVKARIVVDAKQVFIAPQWSPNPNPSPDQVSNLNTDVAFSPSLKDAVIKFDAYLYQSFVCQNKTFCLLADGPWDLRHLLLLEAARKAVSLAPHFRTFFNLRTEFERCYPAAPAPVDRQHLVDYLAIPSSGKAVGLASCHVIANIVHRLQLDNHVFVSPEVIPEFDWAAMSVRVPAIAVPVAAAVPVGGIVRLRGLPWTCVEEDVVNFFVGIPIVPKGIHFVKNAHGKATGEAFVQLHAMESVQHALQRHKQMMGRRYIEVFKSNPVDMSNHLGRADARRQMHQQQVLHAQAHKAAAAAAANAANAAAAVAANSHASRNPSTVPAAPTYMSYGLHTAASHAPEYLSSLHNGAAPTVPLTAPYHHQPQFQRGFQGKGGGRRHSSVSGSSTGKSYVLKLRNLPVHVTPTDVVRLFDGLEMLGDGVHLVPGFDGTPCGGEAFVEFISESQAKKALALSPIEFANMHVTVMRSSLTEMTSTLYPPQHSPQSHVLSGYSDGSAMRGRTMSVPAYAANVVPSLASAAAVVDAVTGDDEDEAPVDAWSADSARIHTSAVSAGGGTLEDSTCFLAEVTGLEEDTDLNSVRTLFKGFGVTSNGVYLYKREDGMFVATVSFCTATGRDDAVAGFSQRKKSSGVPEYDIAPREGVVDGSQRCVLRVLNVPPQCGVADIVEHFSGLEIADCKLGCERDAEQSAWVRFAAASQAAYACETMGEKIMDGRQVRLIMA